MLERRQEYRDLVTERNTIEKAVYQLYPVFESLSVVRHPLKWWKLSGAINRLHAQYNEVSQKLWLLRKEDKESA